MLDLIVAVGAVAVILGALLLGLSGNTRRRARNFCLTFGWLMVIFGLGAEGAAVFQSERSTPTTDAPTP
jgi:VanZ family protein